MSADDIFCQIRDHVRDETADDDALLALASGESGTPRRLELERRAEADSTVRALVALSLPLGKEVESRVALSLIQCFPAEPEARTAVVVTMRRVAAIAGPLAIAASVLLWVLAGHRTVDGGLPLPDYGVSVASQQAMRGAPVPNSTSRLVLHSGDVPFEILLRPATAVGAKVAVYAFAMGERDPNPIDATIDVAEEGSVRIRGRSRALDGAREVRVVIGTAANSIRRFDDALARARAGTSDSAVRVLSVAIVRD